jgi:hypothetical protein
MSNIRSDFAPYFDGNGLMASSPVTTGTLSASDNGGMFLSEFEIILQKLGQSTDQDKVYFFEHITNCMNQGLLCRRPLGQNQSQESVDDYYGVLNGCKQLGITSIPMQFLWSVLKYKGALNNVSPGMWSWDSFLIRQPQILACMVAASFPSWKNPLDILARIACAPFFLIAAIATAVSCIGTDPSDSDSRRLAWHVWQCTKPVSLMCWLAGLLWLNRLKGAYGAPEMQAVAGIYYYPQGLGNNPFSKYWITD